MTSGDLRGRFSEQAPRSLDGTYGLFDNFSGGAQLLSTADNADKSYSQKPFRLFPSGSSDSTNSSEGFGAYESFNLSVTNTKHDSGEYYLSRSSTWSVAKGESQSWRMPYPVASWRSPFLHSDRNHRHSSVTNLSAPSSSFPTSYTRPVPVGFLGRSMPAYVQNQCGGRGGDTAVACRAKIRGFRRLRGAIIMQNSHLNVAAVGFRGTKRKMIAPAPPSMLAKKQRIVRALEGKMELNLAEDGNIYSEAKHMSTEDVERKKFRVREKRRRRREKNREKYGDKHRLAFTCAFCKFHTFEDKDIEKHFGSPYHRETLDYIRRQTKFDDRIISFLHDSMVHKFHKTVSVLRKLHTHSDQKTENQTIMQGVTEDDYMRKVEVVHCMACDVHISAVLTSVQQHLSSPVHLKSKVVYKEQLKRESVRTAKAIINNDSIKARYEKYLKGEDPFITDSKDENSSESFAQEKVDKVEDEQLDISD